MKVTDSRLQKLDSVRKGRGRFSRDRCYCKQLLQSRSRRLELQGAKLTSLPIEEGWITDGKCNNAWETSRIF